MGLERFPAICTTRKFSTALLTLITCFCALYFLQNHRQAEPKRIPVASVHTAGAKGDGPTVSDDDSESDLKDTSPLGHTTAQPSENPIPSDTSIQRTPQKSFQSPQEKSPVAVVIHERLNTAKDQPPSLQEQEQPLEPLSRPKDQPPVVRPHVDHPEKATPTRSHDTQLTDPQPKIGQSPLHRTDAAADMTADLEASPTDSRTSRKFPQVIIIGVRKGGTRALINMLNSHPDIVAAKGEVHYFDRDENFNKGIQWYIDRMPLTAGRQLTIEKSPSYFISEKAPRRMKSLSPGLKLVLIIRDPVERLISDFTQLDVKLVKNDKREKRASLENKVLLASGDVNVNYGPVTVSMYNVHMKHWLEFFGMKSIHVVNGDMLIKNPVIELKKVEVFLGVRPFFQKDMFYFNQTKGFYCWRKKVNSTELVDHCLGSSKGRPHPKVDEEVIQRLKEFYRPHNQRFYSMVNQSFGW